MSTSAEKARRFYTELLRMIYRDTVRRNEEPLTHLLLWDALKRVGYTGVGTNKIKDALDHFRDRGWITFVAEEDEASGRQFYTKIKIAPDGRVAVKGLKPDDTVEIEVE